MSLYVTIEGIDGSGTTSVTKALGKRIGPYSRPFTRESFTTCEPTEFWTGQVARAAFEDRDAHELTRFYLFMADRIEHDDKFITPKLEKGFIVLSDRGPDSTRAYQYHTSGLSEGAIERHLTYTRTPDLTLFLNVDLETALERREGEDAFTDRELQEKVAGRYEMICHEHDRIHEIDANQEIDAVVADCLEVIKHATE